MGSNVNRIIGAALLAAVLVGCGQSPASDARISPSSTEAPNSTDTSDAAEVCADHFSDVRHSQAGTVGDVRTIGPAVLDAPPGELDSYPDDEPIALCLVPRGDSDMFNAVAVVLSDGTTYVRWGQNLDDDFYWPV